MTTPLICLLVSFTRMEHDWSCSNCISALMLPRGPTFLSFPGKKRKSGGERERKRKEGERERKREEGREGGRGRKEGRKEG